MSDAFSKCIDTISSVIFDLHVQGKIDFSEFALFGSYEPLVMEDDFLDIFDESMASLSLSDYRDYMNQKKIESDLVWELSLEGSCYKVA